MRRSPRRPRLRTVVQFAMGILVAGWSLVPIYWGVVVAFASPADLAASPASLLPRSIETHNFIRLLDGTSTVSQGFYTAMLNSIVQSLGTTLLTLVLAGPAAYAFVRIRFLGAKLVLGLITVTLAVPVYLVLIPLFQIETATGLINTQIGVVLVLVSSALPLAIWILRSHLATLPPDIEAAARLDGANTAVVLTRILGPLVAPGLVATALVTFLATWGAFLVPLVYANSSDLQPLTVLIPTFASKYSSQFGLQAAAGLLAVAPPVVLVLALQRHLLSGLLKGATR